LRQLVVQRRARIQRLGLGPHSATAGRIANQCSGRTRVKVDVEHFPGGANNNSTRFPYFFFSQNAPSARVICLLCTEKRNHCFFVSTFGNTPIHLIRKKTVSCIRKGGGTSKKK
jgi:hypothetical protein